jgi:hypothetical protein
MHHAFIYYTTLWLEMINHVIHEIMVLTLDGPLQNIFSIELWYADQSLTYKFCAYKVDSC